MVKRIKNCFLLYIILQIAIISLAKEIPTPLETIVCKNIIIKLNEKESWPSREIEIIKSLREKLPREFFDSGYIYIAKEMKNNSKHPLSIDFDTNTITIQKNPKNDEDFTALILRGLACLLDKKFKYSESYEWRKISQWTGWDILGNHSENINSNGFVSKEAEKNPKEDFIYSILHFFQSPDYKNGCEYLKYKIPLKYNFIRNIFKSQPDPQSEISCSDTCKKWIYPQDIDHIELLIASPSYTSIASIAGHLSLLIKRKNDISGLSTVVSFVANNVNGQGVQEHGWKYVFSGIFGKYKSVLQEETLLELINRQTVLEDRDIYRLRLNLSREQIDRLIQRLWDFKINFNYRYYFFNKNCTTMLLNLINFVLAEDERIRDHDTIDIPLNTVFKTHKALKSHFQYPEFWSFSRNAKFSYNKNTRLRSEILNLFEMIADKSEINLLDHLFAGVINSEDKNRSDYYSRIYNKYYDLIGQNSRKPANIEAVKKIGTLLLEFFINAKDFERFSYQKMLSQKSKAEKNPGDVFKNAKPFFETDEIRLLIKYILNLRHIIKNKFQVNGQEIYDRIENDRSFYARRERKNSPYGCDYGILTVTPEIYKFNGADYFSLALKASTFCQKMGEKSVFSMGAGTSIDLMSLNLILSKKADLIFSERINENWFFDQEFDLLHYKKIFQKNKLKYTGTMNSGFGASLYSHASFKMKKYSKTNYFSLSYILNIFENNNFADFLYMEFGSGFSGFNYYDYNSKYYLDLIMNMSLKYHLFKKYTNSFRGSISYIPRVSTSDKFYNFSELNGKIEVDLNLNARKDIVLVSGINFSKKYYRNNWCQDYNENFKLSFFTTIRFHGSLIPSQNGMKKLLNKLF